MYMIKQANGLADVLGDIESDRLGEKEGRKKIMVEAEDEGKRKHEQN